VETPQDAVRCFLSTGIDYLVMHDTIVAKNLFHTIFSPILKMYSDTAAIVRKGLEETAD
jgi:carbamoyltransferase